MMLVHAKPSGRFTDAATLPPQPIYVCGHCGADVYVEPTEGRWLYRCGRKRGEVADDFSVNCCYRLRCRPDGES